MHKALDAKQFELHYQIQVNHLGKAIGAEALIRWRHPVRGMVAPVEFIPLTEESNLILSIGNWVLETACAQLKRWEKNQSTKDLSISLNVSAKQLRQVDFVQQVHATVIRHRIIPAKLKLELTESMLVDDVQEIIAIMNALNVFGIRFELDDFGTGYSSLKYLKDLPLYQLKIDQSFVRDLLTDSSDKAIVCTVINIAQSLGLGVIAEGVETNEQLLCLLDKGCLHYQGYLFGEPLPIDAFEYLLNKY